MFKDPFSFEGRIRRTEFGLSHIIGTVALWVCFFFVYLITKGSSGGGESMIFLYIFYIPYLWFIWAQGAKRCHDLGNSGWWQLIPLYGFWLLFADGEPGSNEYGANPKSNINQSSYSGSSSNTVGSNGGYTGGYNGGHNGSSSTNLINTNNNGSEYKEGDLYK